MAGTKLSKRTHMEMEATNKAGMVDDTVAWLQSEGKVAAARNVATLWFESRSQVTKVEEGLRQICPKGSLITGCYGMNFEKDGNEVYRYSVVLLLVMTVAEVAEFLNLDGKRREDGAFQEFCREHALGMQIECVVCGSDGDTFKELELCKALGWMLEGTVQEKDGFGDFWLVGKVLIAVGNMFSRERKK